MTRTGIMRSARRFSPRNSLPASDRAGARRRGDRVECDRTERDGDPSQFDPAIARARDCPRRDLRRGTRRRPQGRRLCGRRRSAGRNLGGGRGYRSRSRQPAAARAGGAAHAGCGTERQPVGDRRWTRQGRRHRARPTNRGKNRGAAQQRWRRREGCVHREARPWPLSAHPAPIAARHPGAMGLGCAICAAQPSPVWT